MLTIFLQPTVGPCSITYGVFVFIFIHIKAHWLKSLASVKTFGVTLTQFPSKLNQSELYWRLLSQKSENTILKPVNQTANKQPRKKNGADWIFSVFCRGLLRLAMLMKAALCEVLDVEIKRKKSQTPSNKQLSLLGERKTWIHIDLNSFSCQLNVRFT